MEELKFEDITSEAEKTSEKTEETPAEAQPQKEEKKKKTLKEELIDWGKTLLFWCFLPLGVFLIFCFMANVPTGSMSPTIPVGSQVLTTRLFDKENIERGDIIVFDSDELNIVLIKRCIGLPGETVYFDGTGDVYIDGEKLEEPYVSSFSDFYGFFEIPEEHYFFVGDNRGGSLDARFWEQPYIHKDEIKGKARAIILPIDDFRILN
ncbi:MAG: signal peptidase I [Oscillospiraceae bacterium]|nr:signal peptidase I [Oscillospiraceae bacterium]